MFYVDFNVGYVIWDGGTSSENYIVCRKVSFRARAIRIRNDKIPYKKLCN